MIGEEHEGPLSSGPKGAARFRGAAKSVGTGNNAAFALGEMGVKDAKGKAMGLAKVDAGTRLKRDKSKVYKALAVLMFVAFFDGLGELLMGVALPYIMRPPPPGMVLTQAQIDGGHGAFSEDALKVGIGTAMQIGPSAYTVGVF